MINSIYFQRTDVQIASKNEFPFYPSNLYEHSHACKGLNRIILHENSGQVKLGEHIKLPVFKCE